MANEKNEKRTVVADAPKPAPIPQPLMSDADRITRLEGDKAQLQAALDRAVLKASPNGESVVPGAVRYRLTKPIFRKGVYLEAGEVITAIDEVPGRTWVPLEASAPVVPVAAKSSTIDKDV